MSIYGYSWQSWHLSRTPLLIKYCYMKTTTVKMAVSEQQQWMVSMWFPTNNYKVYIDHEMNSPLLEY